MLRAWFDPDGEFNAAQMVLLSSWSGWTITLVALAVVVVVALAWHNAQTLTRWRRRWLVSLRVAAVLAIAAVFLQPGLRLEHVTKVRNHLVLLTDTSRSMGLFGEGAETRAEGVKAMLADEAALLNQWRQQHQVDLYGYSDHARPIGDPSDLTASGDTTRTLAALDDIAARFDAEDLAGIVIISDGADHGALGVATGEGPTPIELATAERIGAPIHAVFTGPDVPPKDVSIADVAYDDFAFVRNAVSVQVELEVHGYEDALVLPVSLRRDETLLATRMLQTLPDKTRYTLDFEFVPESVGKAVFTVNVAKAPGDRILVNNKRQFVIRVIRDKIRVLQVVGRPSWDERFLRKLLKKNPNVDLISFFILRTSASLDVARRNELSLIPFPTRELFEEQLGSFDLIIFQNFTYRGYQMRQYLPLIRDYVRDGGGFVMVGGDLSFASGGFAGTPIAEFLPVELPTSGALVHLDRFEPQLTEAGRYHPITMLDLVPEANETAWAALPALSGTNRVIGLAPDSAALLVHPTLKTANGPSPVVAVRQFGEGRVLAITSDSTWQWDLLAVGEGGDNRNYYKFWGNAIRWLIHDPNLKPLRIHADRDRYPLGAPVTLIARAFGPNYAPADDAEITLEVRRREDGFGSRREDQALMATCRTDASGECRVRVTPPGDGGWTVTATATIDEVKLTDSDVFIVATDPVELRQTAARRDTLTRLTRAGKGELRGLEDGLEGLERVEPRVLKINRRRDVPLWSSVWFLLIAVLLPSIEWFLRRRWGLL